MPDMASFADWYIHGNLQDIYGSSGIITRLMYISYWLIRISYSLINKYNKRLNTTLILVLYQFTLIHGLIDTDTHQFTLIHGNVDTDTYQVSLILGIIDIGTISAHTSLTLIHISSSWYIHWYISVLADTYIYSCQFSLIHTLMHISHYWHIHWYVSVLLLRHTLMHISFFWHIYWCISALTDTTWTLMYQNDWYSSTTWMSLILLRNSEKQVRFMHRIKFFFGTLHAFMMNLLIFDAMMHKNNNSDSELILFST